MSNCHPAFMSSLVPLQYWANSQSQRELWHPWWYGGSQQEKWLGSGFFFCCSCCSATPEGWGFMCSSDLSVWSLLVLPVFANHSSVNQIKIFPNLIWKRKRIASNDLSWQGRMIKTSVLWSVTRRPHCSHCAVIICCDSRTLILANNKNSAGPSGSMADSQSKLETATRKRRDIARCWTKLWRVERLRRKKIWGVEV